MLREGGSKSDRKPGSYWAGTWGLDSLAEGDPVSSTTTTLDAVAVPTTTASTRPSVSSSTSTTIGPEDHIVGTVEEAEAILGNSGLDGSRGSTTKTKTVSVRLWLQIINSRSPLTNSACSHSCNRLNSRISHTRRPRSFGRTQVVWCFGQIPFSLVPRKHSRHLDFVFVVLMYSTGQRDRIEADLQLEREKSDNLLLNILPAEVALI